MSGDPGRRRVFVAGHRGMVGSAILRAMDAAGIGPLLTRTRSELDLGDPAAVQAWFQRERPDWVVLAAARVGGILANQTRPAEFLVENLAIAQNVVRAAHATGVSRLLFLGSSCIYPRLAPQPMREDCLLTGALEPTNEPYAIAKIAGIKLCESFHRQYGCDFRSVMPTNLYGPGDNFDLHASHVVPALMRRIHEAHVAGAEEVQVWGTGRARREFLHVDDLAQACLHVLGMEESRYWGAVHPMCSHLNVGTGLDLSIAELAEEIRSIVGYPGRLAFDASKPDGAPRKLLDVGAMANLGWRSRIALREGLVDTYAWFRAHHSGLRGMEPPTG